MKDEQELSQQSITELVERITIICRPGKAHEALKYCSSAGYKVMSMRPTVCSSRNSGEQYSGGIRIVAERLAQKKD